MNGLSNRAITISSAHLLAGSAAGVKAEGALEVTMDPLSDDEVEEQDSPEMTIRRLESRLAEETQRLERLYEAYRKAEDEIADKQALIEVLEKEALNREIEREGLEHLLSEKDNRIRELELDGAKSNKRVEHLEPELEKMEEKYSKERAMLGRVYEITEELDEQLQTAQSELGARDDWYVQNMKVFEDLNQAIKERYEMIESAVQKAAEFQKAQESFKQRMEEAILTAQQTGEPVPVGENVEVSVDPGEDGVLGTDDDEINIQARTGSDSEE